MHKHGGDIYRNIDVIDYSANINPGGLPDKVIAAAIEGVKLSTHYPDVECQELRAAIAKEEGLNMDYIRCGNGAADVIFSLVLAVKPKKALLIAPSFYEYEQALRAVDCQISYYYLEEENDFVPQDDMLEAINDELDILFVCNPNNPTGVLLDTAFLDRILDKCNECNILMVIDECFNDLIDEPDKYTMKARLESNKRLFILKAFTKIYAMPGLRLGYGLSSDNEIINKMILVSQPWSVSIPAQKAGLAALEEKEYVKETMAEIGAEKKILLQGLKELGIKTYGAGANYIFFKASESFDKECLEKKIMIRDCSNYEGLTKGYYRIAVRGHEDNQKLLEAFAQIMK